LPALAAVLATVGSAAAEGLKERAVLKARVDPVSCLAFSPDGKTLALGGPIERGGRLLLWDLASGKESKSLETPAAVDCLAFSPDGKTLAAHGSHRDVLLWDVRTGQQSASLACDFSVHRLAFSSDGKRVAAADDTEMKLWEVGTGKELSSFRRRWVGGWSPAFSPDLRTLASPMYQDVDLWDVASGKEQLMLPDHRGLVASLSFSADGKTLAVGSYRFEEGGKYFAEVKLWDAVSGKERATFKGDGDLLLVLLSADGKTLVQLGSKALHWRYELKALDVDTGRVFGVVPFKTMREAPRCLALSPDGKAVAAGFADGSVRLWEVAPPERREPPGK
jgi:WD40 repeat protein